MIREKLLKDMEFIMELDKLKTIERRIRVIGQDRKESVAEHSWHISLMAMLLAEYTNEEIDLLKVIKMLLIHDLVDIYAKDMSYDDNDSEASQKEKELAAAEKLYAMLDRHKADELRDLWDEFEARETPESIFANLMDKLQPILMNYRNDGGTWKEYNISKSEIYDIISPLKDISDELWCYANFIIEDASQKGIINKNII